MTVIVIFLFGFALALAREIPYGIENRITGGDPANPAQFPFQIGLRIRTSASNPKYTSWCGGSLISDQYVLTAAHCLVNGFSAHVYLGLNDLSKDNEQGRVIVGVQQRHFIIHEKYDPSMSRNDIALIKLPYKIALSKYIQPVDLPRISQKDETFEGITGIISGWGIIGDGKLSSKQLLFIPRKILPKKNCYRYYENYYEKNTQVCVDSSEGKSACRGDSGGPLTIVDETGRRILLGVSSYGKAYCEKNVPSVYTRVTAYLDWISKKSGISLKD